MPTFTLISSVTVGAGGASSIDFTSIPNTYTDLCLKVSAKSTTGGGDSSDGYNISFNGVTTNLSSRSLSAYGTTAYSGSSASVISGGVLNGTGASTSIFNNDEIYVPNYANGAAKSVSIDYVNESNSASGNGLGLRAGLWNSTSVITRITLTPSSGSFAQYSTAYLYGVSNA